MLGGAVLLIVGVIVVVCARLAAPLDYAPLPKAVVAKVESTVKSITVKGAKSDLATAK